MTGRESFCSLVTDSTGDCAACSRPEVDEKYVQCDLCDRWWHFTCAGVTDSVADRSWKCQKCLPVAAYSKSSNKSARIALQLKKLEEERAIQQRALDAAVQLDKKMLEAKYSLLEEQLEEEEEIGSHRSRISHRENQQRVKQWVELHPANIGPSDEAAGGHPLPAGTEHQQEEGANVVAGNPVLVEPPKKPENSKPLTGSWTVAKTAKKMDFQSLPPGSQVINQPSDRTDGQRNPAQVQHSTMDRMQLQRNQQRYTGAIPKTAPKLPVNDRDATVGSLFPPVPPVQPPGKPLFRPILNPERSALPSHSSYQERLVNLRAMSPILENENSAQLIGTEPVFQGQSTPTVPPSAPLWRNPIETAPRANNGQHPIDIQNTYQTPPAPRVPESGPSPSQLAARHVMARDLPQFSGNPEDWPIFISSFNNSTLACGYNGAENLARLQRCLKGHAYESVKSRLLLPESVPQVIETLRLLYGRPELLISALLQKVRSVPAPKADRLETIIDFGLAVRTLCDHLEAAGLPEHLSNPTLLMELVEKLPPHTKMQWAERMQQHAVVNLKTFGDFMQGVVTAVSRVTTHVGGSSSGQQKQRQKGAVNSHTSEARAEPVSESEIPKERLCFCCKKSDHRIAECTVFKSYSVDDRWKFAQSNGLCRSCLNAHGRRTCRNSAQCVIEGCQYRHHPLLHSNRSTGQPTPTVSTVQNHIHRQQEQALLFRIVPVILSGPRASIETYAFLDDGSDLSLVESSLVEQLGIDGWTKPLCLKWTGNVTRVEPESKQVRISIRGSNSPKPFFLNDVRTVKEITLPEQSLDYADLAQRYRYLQGLPIVSYEKAVPRLLIGVNNVNLTVPLQVKEGKKDEPIGVKTRLGWTVFGGSGKGNTHTINFHSCECACDQELHQTVKDYLTMEDAGVKPVPALESEEDKRARSIMEQTTVRVGDRFETGLLWRYDDVELPDSYKMAVKRFECLERRMNRDPVLAANLKKQIEEYVAKGYAHRATEDELKQADPKRIWYLPLGAVTNPRKPGKVRLVWDAAAQVNGISLNSMLLKGPDQLTSLPNVLFVFRQFWVGVSADIKEMFHQMLIRALDRHALRFLFRNDPSEPLETFMMDVATFGATCSPASAQYVKNTNAAEFADGFPRAVEGIIKNHYVDDYLDSFESEDEAVRVSQEVKTIHQKGGFHIRNWLSNSTDVLGELNEEEQLESKNLCLSATDGNDRVLGMLWQTAEDELQFSVKMKDEVQAVIDSGDRPTKRQMLKCLMGIFDPLGLLSVFLVHGKILLQDAWRAGLKWDEEIPNEIFDRWTRWTGMFRKIADLRIPRCYFVKATRQTYDQLQLHIFVDASEAAFSAVAYFRVVDAAGKVECTIVAAKTKVAPLKPLSIPRLELQAAVLGSRLMSFVQDGHNVEVKQRFLWSDSATVLAWLRADHRRYKQYVACRVGELLTATDVAEWRWVPSKLNPADAATKWGKNPCPDATDEWFRGPEFLRLPEEEWPKQANHLEHPEEELRPCFVIQGTTIPATVVNFSRFSKWRRLLGTVAYVHRFADNCRRKVRGEKVETSYLSQDELKRAKNTVMRMVQREEYPDEMEILARGETEVHKTSCLYQLTPIVDEYGVMRVGGRTGAAPHATFDAKFPVILPRKHTVTRLIVDDFHRAFRHRNSETVVNEVRQFYNIARLRTVVKQVTAACQWCKVAKAIPTVPRMAPLPAARLSSFTRPFTYVGIDLFGPLLVKVGRSTAKRWICLFTCLTTRAVHVEVAYSLSTSSCVSCIRRFVCRRGAPAEIYSDNGTNFQGAENVLRKQIEEIQSELAATFTNTDTKWIFIPPAAPHMGGAWERMVRSVKTAMQTAYNNDRKLDDEGLETLVVEAEGIVNSRPLTYLPLDADEGEALTPNHFLLGSSRGVRQPTVAFIDPVTALKNSWNQIQHQLDIFWKRWTREYLPVLTRRMKWFGDVKPVAEGDLVLIIDDGRRNGWLRGRVKEVVPSKDGRVRQAVVQTARGILKRPVAKLAVLDVGSEGKTGTGGQCYGGEDVAAGRTAPTVSPVLNISGANGQPVHNNNGNRFTNSSVDESEEEEKKSTANRHSQQ